MTIRRYGIGLFFLLGVFGLAGASGAQTSFPMICASYPAGVQRGKTTEVTIMAGGGGGGSLYGAYKVLFAGEGVKAEIVPPAKGWPARDPKKPNPAPTVGEVMMRVTVAPDAPLGVREYRVATGVYGISTVGLLTIGDEPEINETEPNNDPEHAQAITLPMVVNGKIQQGEDVDWYKFQATAGQEVVFAVRCARLEDKMHDLQEHCDPLIILSDTAGNELARNDDYYRADPLLHYKFEKAGTYLVQIRDVGYKGNPYWVYRMEITSRPYVVATVPCAVRPGQSAEMNVVGFNLGSTRSVHLDVPANVPPGLWYAPLHFPNGVSNSVPLRVVDAPQQTFLPPANSQGKAVTAALKEPASLAPRGALALPCSVNSWIDKEGQPDRYTFHARKG